LGLEGEGKEGDEAEEGDEFHGNQLYGLGGEGEGIFMGRKGGREQVEWDRGEGGGIAVSSGA